MATQALAGQNQCGCVEEGLGGKRLCSTQAPGSMGVGWDGKGRWAAGSGWGRLRDIRVEAGQGVRQGGVGGWVVW
eukprot:CAMPEP_0117669940 /NCGR_PEP_ID=MMETSP0804-20121206/12437_1 /TAXON_ID=1074897 /ORGANISM="Tetraselmis astigmatica, Strain CCMP880" /LENGTH=74 /DNA_ID=CAMNT_0005478105 /DNA_START=221 /DNA_END=442 /DNA_ORIENTATION=-